MNKAELIDHLSSGCGLTKADTERVLNATLATIKNTVKENDSVTLVGFGTFSRIQRRSRSGVNPRTGENIQIPASTVPKFKAGKAFLDFLK